MSQLGWDESLATQIRDEVTRGNLIKSSSLSDTDRVERESRLEDARLSRLSKSEMATVPYTDDQRLDLLCRALLTAAQSMLESRRALRTFTRMHELPPVVRFMDVDETTSIEFNLATGLLRAEPLARLEQLMRTIQQEGGVRP